MYVNDCLPNILTTENILFCLNPKEMQKMELKRFQTVYFIKSWGNFVYVNYCLLIQKKCGFVFIFSKFSLYFFGVFLRDKTSRLSHSTYTCIESPFGTFISTMLSPISAF